VSDELDPMHEIAAALGMTQAQEDTMRLQVMESHEKAAKLLETVKSIGHNFSVVGDDGDVYVNVAWLGTMMLMEADQTMRGHGGCADHLRLADLVQTTILAAITNVEDQLDTTD